MPIYEGRTPGTSRVVVWSKGKAHEKVVPESEAKDAEAELRLALRGQSSATRKTGPTFFEFSTAEYVPHATEHLGASTWRRTRRYQLATLIGFFGETRLTEFSTDLVEAFKRERLAAKISTGVVNEEMKILGTVLRFAKEHRGQAVAEFRIPWLPDAPQARVKLWTTEQCERLLVTARRRDPSFEPWLSFLLNTGVRKGESIAAEWTWVDERARLLRIPVTEYWRPKNKRPREVPLGDVVWSVLRRLPRSSRWLFPRTSGERYALFPDMRLTNVLRAAKLVGSPHWTRHTYASHFLQSMPDLWKLATIMGHSHTRVTELYTHLLPNHLADARNAVNLGGSRPAKAIHGATMARRRAS